jgi:NHLM bacteriocin system ABC transporter peptidase/ATP-binding protein
MEAAECGAAALGIVLGHYGRWVPLEELRSVCGVSRDGSKALNVVRAARGYGMTATGYRKEPLSLRAMRLPLIVFWEFNHFLVVEGFGKNRVYLNDPASGPRTVTDQEFDQAFTGVVLELEPGPDFKRGGARRSLFGLVSSRLAHSRAAVAYLLLTGLALVLLGLVIPGFSRVFIDRILVDGQSWVWPLLAGMALTALLRAVVTGLQQHYLLRLEARLAVGMASAFVWHILRLPVEFFTQRDPGDISARVALNDRVARLLAGDLANAILNLIVIVFYVAVMLQYDLPLTLVGVLTAVANLLILHYVARRRVDDSQRLQLARSKLVSATIGGLQNIETIKSTGRESDFFARWAGQQAKLVNELQRAGLLARTMSTLPLVLTALNTAAILTLGGARVIDGSMSVGTLVAFQSLMATFLAPVNQLVNLGGMLQDVEGDLNRLDDVRRYRLDPMFAPAEAPQAEQTDGQTPASTPTRLNGALELRGVTFGYSRLDPPLIDGLNLTLRPGDRVALVGGSGSGKSTVAKLVGGLYQPWGGEILFDGRPRGSIPRRLLARSLTMVDQDVALFEGTIRENLTLWDATVPEGDLVRAARDAAIHADIVSRPGGYDHPVSEAGRNFSGGQRQRLEIARALVPNPTLLVMDEATSALDTLSEQQIDQALRRRGCTTFIVAHRLSTIRDCDEIVVLDRGKVVQRGTHDQMIRVDGPYARLVGSEEYQKSRPRSVLDRL